MHGIDLLELRIHGIANSPPADMLSTTAEELVRKDGDEQGSFWQVKPKTHDGSQVPGAESDLIEAYSWGNQARSGGSPIALIGRAIVHVAWLFVLPFGLCNLAYWARRDIKGEVEETRWWAGGDGAIAIRVFALLQTLFYMVGFMTVFVYLVSLQCFQPSTPEAPATTCAALPGWLDFLSTWTPTARAAILSVMPIAIILLIYIVSIRARRLFNPESSFNDEARSESKKKNSARVKAQSKSSRTTNSDAGDSVVEPDVAPPRPALLATAGFWQRSRVAHTTERSHLAGAIALVLFLLAYDALHDAHPGVGPFDLLYTLPEAFASAPAQAAGTVGGGLLLVGAFIVTGAAGLSGEVVSIRSKRGWSTGLLVVTIVAYLAWLAWALLIVRDPATAPLEFSGDAQFRGLIIAPTVIAAIGALIAVASLAWGLGWRRPVVYTLLVMAFVAVGVAELGAKGFEEDAPFARLALSSSTVILVVLAVAIAYIPSKKDDVREARRLSAWHGNGASVALLLALLSSLVITSLLVLGAHAWLTADTDSPAVKDARRVVDPPADAAIAAPEFYERFAGMLVVLLVVMVVTVTVAVTASLWRFPAFSLPSLAFPPSTPDDVMARDAYRGGTHQLPARYPENEVKPSGRERAVADARRVAGLLHRGEPILRVLAILTAVALVPLAVPFWGELLDGQNPWNALTRAPSPDDAQATGLWTTLSSASGWALGLLALAAVTWVVTNAVTSTERPLGLVWDIVCFFPSAGHPFGPPCYGERAVPEVTKEIRRHIRDNGENARVILSAHSMGATIAAAAIFALRVEEDGREAGEKVALLTHGVQLRAYFSRFFPQVFGARVLGIKGTLGPSLWRRDPWTKQVEDDFKSSLPPAHDGDPKTLVALLGGVPTDPHTPPRWRSLWRRTDPLGFPITGYWNREENAVKLNPIDRGATERSPRTYLWMIARHEDYISTLQYQAARQELVDMFEQDSDGTESIQPGASTDVSSSV